MYQEIISVDILFRQGNETYILNHLLYLPQTPRVSFWLQSVFLAVLCAGCMCVWRACLLKARQTEGCNLVTFCWLHSLLYVSFRGFTILAMVSYFLTLLPAGLANSLLHIQMAEDISKAWMVLCCHESLLCPVCESVFDKRNLSKCQ